MERKAGVLVSMSFYVAQFITRSFPKHSVN